MWRQHGADDADATPPAASGADCIDDFDDEEEPERLGLGSHGDERDVFDESGGASASEVPAHRRPRGPMGVSREGIPPFGGRQVPGAADAGDTDAAHGHVAKRQRVAESFSIATLPEDKEELIGDYDFDLEEEMERLFDSNEGHEGLGLGSDADGDLDMAAAAPAPVPPVEIIDDADLDEELELLFDCNEGHDGLVLGSDAEGDLDMAAAIPAPVSPAELIVDDYDFDLEDELERLSDGSVSPSIAKKARLG